jgi:hypothetical protein
MLLAEEFVLLALHPDGTLARGVSSQAAVGAGVTGALVTELAQEGHVDLSDGVIRVTGTRPSAPLLAVTLDELARCDGKKLKSRLASIRCSGWAEVVDGMVERGVLGRERHGVHPTRHPVTDATLHAQLLERIRAAAAGDGPIDPRTATLLALAGPAQLLEVVAPDRSGRSRAKARIAEAAQQVPAAAAVKHVVDSMNAAVIAVT